MKKLLSFFLAFLLLLSTVACSGQQAAGALQGSMVGGMVGSGFGGMMNGPRGHDRGIVAGAFIGGILGAVAFAPQDQTKKKTSKKEKAERPIKSQGRDDEEVYYRSTPSKSDLEKIEVLNLKFFDENRNDLLDPGEEAFVEMDIFNRGSHALYNLTPSVICSDSSVRLSEPALISTLPAGEGVRYRIILLAPMQTLPQEITFTVGFPNGKRIIKTKLFKLRTF